MNKNKLLTFLISIFLFGFLLLFVIPVNAYAFRFVSWADTKSAKSTLATLSNQIRALSLQPIFTIYPGDLESSGFTSSGMAAWKDAINGYSNNNGMFDITFAVRGNHDDSNTSGWQNYFNFSGVASRVGTSNYKELDKNLTYSFDYGNAHFIGVDVPGNASKITTRQTAWIDQDLTQAEGRGLTHAFIFFHGPIYYISNHSGSVPQHLITVINKHTIVSATFHGHEHAYAWTHIDSGRISTVTHEFEQLVTGSAGAGPTSCSSGRCDYDLRANGYSTIDVDGQNFTVKFFKKGQSSAAWTKTFNKSGSPPITFTPGPTKTVTLTPSPTPTSTPGGPQTAYPNGVPHTIPGRIEAENFDRGGSEVAYHDYDSGNNGNSNYRSGEQVDISSTSDSGGGNHVGWTEANEWLEYTVNVQTSGTYTFQARVVNNASGGKFRMEMDGSNKTGSIIVPNTSTWSNWQTIEKTVSLSQGQHIMRIYYETVASGGAQHVGDYNWFNFIKGSGTTPTGTGTPGDANGDGKVNITDYIVWIQNFDLSRYGPSYGDFNSSGFIDSIDYTIWMKNYTGSSSSPTPTSSGPTPTGQPGYIDHAKCNPDLGSNAFTHHINNQYLPFSTGMNNDHVIYNSSTGEKVRFRIFNYTKNIPGLDGQDPVKAVILEEYETVNNNWIETSYNWFAQTMDGTVCYMGENTYTPGNPNGGAHGSWEAGKNGAKAGIMMPPNPTVGQNWIIEDASADGAYEDGVVQATGVTYNTPAGTFNNTIYIIEDFGASKKRYAPGIGMIYDDGLVLTNY